jgi:hypothetical protein
VLSDLAAWRRPVDDVDHWATRQGEREHVECYACVLENYKYFD